MAYMKAGWSTTRTSPNTYETWPSHDVIEHRHSFTCPCNPKVEGKIDDYGDVWWYTIHNSFDETLDESQTEPYTGLW